MASDADDGVCASSRSRSESCCDRRRGGSLLLSSLALEVPQPPLVASRRLLTSAAATTPAALGALSGLAQMPRRRRLRASSDPRAPFLDSDGVSGNQGRPYAALMCRRTEYIYAFGEQSPSR